MKTSIAPAPERVAPVGAPEASPFPNEDTQGDVQHLDQPSAFDLAEEFGAAVPVRDEDIIPDDGTELPDLEVVEKRIPETTKVLMEELLRAKLTKVQRVNPKKIR